jgi:L-cysteate sulfo-lyase
LAATSCASSTTSCTRHVSSGADTIVSGGVVQSNSQRQVAAVAAKLGLACHLAVYHGRLEPPTPEYKMSGNAFLNRLFGAHLHDVPWTGDRNAAIRALVDDLQAKGHKPYFVPYGVSNALGAVAYATTIARSNRRPRIGFCATVSIVHCYRQRRHAGRPRRRCRRRHARHADRRD